MKWQGKIGFDTQATQPKVFVIFLLIIFGQMTLIQKVAKAREDIGRQQAIEIAADYLQPSHDSYIQEDEVQESTDAFVEQASILGTCRSYLSDLPSNEVKRMLVGESTDWMRPTMMANMSRMMDGQIGMMGPMSPSTWGNADLAFETNSVQMGPMMMRPGMHWTNEKNPAAAALLSLQPTPVALGNFYTDDWEKGILYTTLEVGMFIPGTILLGDRYFNHHFHDGDTRNSWTDTEQSLFISLVTGYVVVKVISAFDAAYSAERYIRRGKRISLKASPKVDSWTLKTRVSF